MARGRRRDETGQSTSSALLLIVVLVVVVIAVVLLQRTASTAEAINKKAATISKTGRGINDNTDSILQLTKTNKLGTSILNSAKPLQGQLAQVVDLANSINGLATSINGSAGTIDGTAKAINSSAGAINSTANGINSTASSILTVANSIKSGVAHHQHRTWMRRSASPSRSRVTRAPSWVNGLASTAVRSSSPAASTRTSAATPAGSDC